MAKSTPADIAAQTYAITAPKPLSDHDVHKANLVKAITVTHAAAQQHQNASAMLRTVHSQMGALVHASARHLAAREAIRKARKMRGPV